MSNRDFYEILGVDRSADAAALKSAYRKLAKQWHPDANPGSAEAEARFKEMNEAYAVLSDPEKRAQYDRFGRAAFQGGGGPGQGGFSGDFSDLFNEVFADAFGDFFGGQRGPSRRSGPERGSDLRYDLEITLEQAFSGAERQVVVPAAATCEPCSGIGATPGTSVETCATCGGVGQVRASQGLFRVVRPCPSCGGAGRTIKSPCKSCGGLGRLQRDKTLAVKIPAGVEDGTRIRLSGEGDSGGRGGPPGDLYIFLSVKPHAIFERDAQDLYCRATVPMATAALGGEVEIPTIDGRRAKVNIPEGAQTGRRLRLKGDGMPSLRSRDRGDLHVELFVETPSNLTAKQRKLLEEFASACGKEVHPQSHGFFDTVRRFFDQGPDGPMR